MFSLCRVYRVCAEFIYAFFDRLAQDTSGAFDGIDLETAREKALQRL